MRGYLRLHRNGYGEVVRSSHLPAINMRRLKEPGRYGLILENGQIHSFEEGEVFHFKNYDVAQTIYGKPRYLGAIQSMLLNEDATLFAAGITKTARTWAMCSTPAGPIWKKMRKTAYKKP